MMPPRMAVGTRNAARVAEKKKIGNDFVFSVRITKITINLNGVAAVGQLPLFRHAFVIVIVIVIAHYALVRIYLLSP